MLNLLIISEVSKHEENFTNFSVSCYKSGVKFEFTMIPNVIRFCANPYYFQKWYLTTEFYTSYPQEILIKEYVTSIENYYRGKLVNQTNNMFSIKFL